MPLFLLLLFVTLIVFVAQGDQTPLRRSSRNFKYLAKPSLRIKDVAKSSRHSHVENSTSTSSTSSSASLPIYFNDTLSSTPQTQSWIPKENNSPALSVVQMKLRRLRRENKLMVRKIKEMQSVSVMQCRESGDGKQEDDIHAADLGLLMRSIFGAETQRTKENYVCQLRRLYAQNLMLRCRLSFHEDRPR